MNFIKALENETNVSVTENGAKGFKTTFNELVDFNFKVPSFRSCNEDRLRLECVNLINSNIPCNVLYRYLFYLRDIRGGMGERKVFRFLLKELARKYPKTTLKVVPLIVEYGRWDDLFVLDGTVLEDEMYAFVSRQFCKDLIDYSKGNPVSLLAKWLPSINSSDSARKKALKFVSKLELSKADYRKALSNLRERIDIVEHYITSENFAGIDYEAVPSCANKMYAKLFMLKDYERRKEYIVKLVTGEAKVNSSTLYPHEIVSMVRKHASKDLADAMWKGLREFEMAEDTLVVADVSGSMFWGGLKNIVPLDCSIGLGLYFAERGKGGFKGKVVTFSDTPTLVDVSNFDSLSNAYSWMCYQMDWGGTTNIHAVLKLVLDTAVKNRMVQEDIPNILIISDMEFNGCARGMNLFKSIEKQYKEYGYSLPKITFWNVASRTNTIPMKTNEYGVALVSGYSPASVKACVGNYDPYESLLQCFFTERYDIVETYLGGKN